MVTCKPGSSPSSEACPGNCAAPLVVNAKLPVKTVQDFVAMVKAKPGEFNYGTTGVGAANHLVTELLSSKYALVIYAAKRARQINDYYNQLGEGILEYVGPLVEPGLQEKPLSIALREIHSDLLEHTEGE